ncbi:LysR family transcriptional regulator [[Eubacterium] hominis]|uniref:LysR family transcriptional regulator n=1 Tax=[Eubacterium] hominis TaxID=2764325 RepID=UPI003A4E2B51
MEIHHLQQLLTIAECGSINRAAQKLYISQPSLNNIVKRCEHELGFLVFLRTPKGVTLTEKGEKLMDIIKTILAEYKKIEVLAPQHESDTISISFIYLSYLWEAFLNVQEMGLTFSNMLQRTNPSQVLKDVITKNAHIGILPIYQADMNDFVEHIKQYHLQYLTLFESVQTYVIVSKKHPLANRKSISMRETLTYPLTYYTTLPDTSMLKQLYHIETSLKVQNRDELFLALKNHSYVSFLTLTSDSKHPDFCYIPIKEEAFQMNICVIFFSDTGFTKQEETLFQILKNTIPLITA